MNGLSARLAHDLGSNPSRGTIKQRKYMSNSSNKGIGVLTVIGIVLVVLKVVGLLDSWSWWLVLLPFYGSVLIGIFLLGVFFLIGKIFTVKTQISVRRKNKTRG